MKKWLFLVGVFVALATVILPASYDLTKPEDKVEAFMKVRAHLEGKDVVYYWAGKIYSFAPGQKSKLLFKCEGFNVARAVKREEGWFLFSREGFFYQDPDTGKILEKWLNPFTSKEVEVVHVWNDPVNVMFKYDDSKSYIKGEYRELGDTICWYMDALLRYPSPLKRSEYPLYSQDDFYQAGELFQFYSSKSDLDDPGLKSVPAVISWARIGPWLPFMEMADRPGYLVYHCRGRKLPNGFSDLPKAIRQYVEKHFPKYKKSPSDDSEKLRNETSWTYFKKQLDMRKKKK
jgi:hypothetical protein